LRAHPRVVASPSEAPNPWKSRRKVPALPYVKELLKIKKFLSLLCKRTIENLKVPFLIMQKND
jgi:hypothetical protein